MSFSLWDAGGGFELYRGHALDVVRTLEPGAADAVVTSPPYLDARPEYDAPSSAEFEALFVELARVVDGPVLVNVGRLWRYGRERLWWLELVEAADAAGLVHRDTLVWAKQNANPIQGAVVSNAHEYVLLFGDGFDTDAVRTAYAPGSVERMGRRHVSNVSVKGDDSSRNGARRDERRGETRTPNPLGARASSVVVTPTGREKGNRHPAPMPLELAEYLVLLSGGRTVLDPFAGSGTTGLAALRLGRSTILVELDADYCSLASRRLAFAQLRIDA